MRVADVMTCPLVTIQHDTTVAAAWAIMRERGSGTCRFSTAIVGSSGC